MLGPPGARKVLVSKMLLIYSSSLGLNAAITLMPSEKSNQSGGAHLHLLFKMNVNEKITFHPILEANQCICDLTRNEASLDHLHGIDVLIIDEIRLLN